MDVSSVPKPQAPPATFLDRLGGRFIVRDRTGANVEILVFTNELASAPGFEVALRETVSRLTDFRHPSVRRVRGLARLAEPDNRLALVSDLSPGSRLSELLYAAEQDHREVDTRGALVVVRDLLAAATALNRAAPGVSHGAIGPERILVTPDGRVLLVEYTLGAGLECHASLPTERLWKEFRLPVHEGTPPRFGPRTDVVQIGLVALSLLLGRLLRRDEYPRRVSELLLEVGETDESGSRVPLGLALRAWLLRTLQVSAQDSYGLVEEAHQQFEVLLGPEGSYAVRQADVLTLLGIAEPLPALEAPPRPAEPAREAASRPAPGGVRGANAVPVKPLPPKVTVAEPRTQSGKATPVPAHQAPIPAVASVAADAPAPQVAPSRPRLTPILTVATAEMAAHMGTQPPDAEALEELPGGSRRPLSAEELELPPGVACVAQDVRSEPTSDSDHPVVAAAHAGALRVYAAQTSADTIAVHDHRRDGTLFATPEAGTPLWQRVLSDRRFVIGAVAIAILTLSVPLGVRSIWSRLAAGPAIGTLKVDSRPPGAEVFVDGRARGRTPLLVRLAPGAHRLEVGSRSNPQVIPVSIAGGAQVQQYVEFPEVPERGDLRVVSEPPGARVFVDGTPRGSAPMTVTGLTPGEHSVALEGDAGTVRQTVTIASGATASLVVPLAGASAAQQGWIAVNAPVPMQLVENGRVLGTSQGDAVAVPVGRHAIELVNATVGYRETRSINVTAGKMSSIAVEMPLATLSLNAVPWAEVWVDGRKVGDTPLGNLSLPAGPHEVLFRHPQLGEQRQTVVVKLPGPTLVSVDLRK